MNIGIIFSAIHIHIRKTTCEKFHCCGDAPVNCIKQFFCHYFYNCCSRFSTLDFLFTLLTSFIVTIYLSSDSCWLNVYFLSIYRKRTTHLAQEKSRKKKVVQFFQNTLVYWFFIFFSAMRRHSTVLSATCMAFSVHNNFYVKYVWIKKVKSG